MFCHAVAILNAPEYRAENAGALRQDWPRVPLLEGREVLLASAELGRQVAALLDTEWPVPGVTAGAIRRELEEIYAELDTGEDLDDTAVVEAIRQRNVADWEREALEEADRVESGFGTRYIAVPRDDTHEAYRDMADFVTTVADERLRERLADAIDGRGAFSRFKRVLSDHDEDRERWFVFRDARLTRS